MNAPDERPDPAPSGPVDRLRRLAPGLRSRPAAAGEGPDGLEALRARVADLEEEVGELRRLNLRLAELTDVVQELLLPLASSDPARAQEVLDRYSAELGR